MMASHKKIDWFLFSLFLQQIKTKKNFQYGNIDYCLAVARQDYGI